MERYRIDSAAAVYFVTYSVVEWLPVFVTEAACRVVAESLSYCHRHKQLRINAFVIMPTHLHLIVFDSHFSNERLAGALTDFRKFTGRQLSELCTRQYPKCFVETLREQAISDRERRFWQPSTHRVAIQTEGFWRQKIDYLHNNPRRKGLVRHPQDWRWSSAGWYAADGGEVGDVPLTGISW